MPDRRETLVVLAGTIAATVISPRAVLAHHGFTGRYDDARPIYVEGVVRSASFRRPHPVIEMKVDDDLRTPTDLPEGEEFEVLA